MKIITLNTRFVALAVVLFLYLSAFSQDYKVQHLQDDIARTGGTNTGFTAVASLNNAVALANNNRKVSAGCNGCTGNLEGDDLAGARQLTATNTLSYYRESGSKTSNMRFNTSIWEYIGSPGGANEMIVRGRYAVTLNGGTNSKTQAVTGVSNAKDCIPFITGIMNNATANDSDSGTALAYLENASTLRVRKGSNGNNVTVYVTLVEFTGSNWTVLHGDSGSVSGDTGTITLRNNSDGSGIATNVSAWNKSIIFSHHIGDTGASGANDAIADNWPVMDPGSNNQRVDWTFHSGHDSAGTNRHFVHVLSNSGLNVTRYQNTSSSAGETTINIASAGLSSISEALIVGSSKSSGTGSAYGRGWRNYYIKSTTQAAHWVHRNNNSLSHEIQIIDLSGLNSSSGIPEIDVTGNSISIVDGDTTPDVLDDTDFGSVNFGAPLIRTFTINNSGTANLNISSIMLSNITDFSLTGTPYSTPVAASGSTTFTITFDSPTLGGKDCTVTIANDDGDESNYQFKITARSIQNFFDSDGDGVLDHNDVDDDNDGILDNDEEADCKNGSLSIKTNYKYLNETFGTGGRTTINTTYSAKTSYCYEDGTNQTNTGACPTLSSPNLNDGEYVVYFTPGDGDGTNDTPNAEVASWADAYWYTGNDHTPDDTNGRMAMFNASYAPGIFYSAYINGALPNTPISYDFWVINLDRTDAPGIGSRLRPNILVEFRDLNNNLLASITTGDIPPTTASNPDGDWYNFSADLTFSVSEFHVYFYNNETGGLGNDLAIDDIVIAQTLCDTDGDYVADVFDLDSDNDGIPDAVEAGWGYFTNGDGTLAASWQDLNNNGLHDSVEGFTAIDSDGDGRPDYIDLDSDNDTIFDVDEAKTGNTADPNFKNEDGDISGNGFGQGIDSDNVREKDFDSNGASEFFPDGILDVYDYFNGGTMADAYGNQNQGIGLSDYVKDTDSDGTPDYLDIDSDNDGIYDIAGTLYSNLDANIDGVIDDTNDSDQDGILDLFDTDDAAFGSPRDLDRKLQLYFDGRNDYIEDSSVINAWSEATQMGWIKIDPTASGSQIIMGQNTFYIQLNSNKTITAYADGYSINNGSALTTNQWVHVAATYSDSNSIFKLFINGLEVNSTPVSGALSSDTSKYTIGRTSGADNSYFMGFIDEVRLFHEELTTTELQKMVYQEIENNTLVRGAIVPRDITSLPWSDLKRYYRLDTYKDDITDDLTTPAIDTETGAKMYNFKYIDYQTAPLPFVTQQSGTLPTAVDIATDGINGNDAVTYDWSIVKVEHNDVTYNADLGHLALIVNEFENSTPIEYHVQNDSELNVSWYLKLDGLIDLEGESQLVQGDESLLDVTSKGMIEKDQQGTADLYTYNYWSAPVGISNTTSNNNSFTVPDIMKDEDQEISFLTSGYDGTNTAPIGIADYWIWKFANQLDDDYSAWQHVRSTGSILAGEGYTMKGPGSGPISSDQNYVFKGKPNNGDINLSITAGNDYLVGNPYASAIDSHAFINDNAATIEGSGPTTGTLYFWEHWGGGSHVLAEYLGGYATYNLSGGTPSASLGTNDPDVGTGGTPTKIPGRYIPVSQGFFVIGESTGTINFNNAQRAFQKEGGSSQFMMPDQVDSEVTPFRSSESSSDDDVDTRIKIRIGLNSVNTIHRQLLLTVDENATLGIDYGYDALLNENQMDDMYWMMDEDKYVIQAIDNIDEYTVLPIGIHAKSNGLNTIRIDSIENQPAEFGIYLHDKELGLYHSLSDGDYEFYMSQGMNLDRFEIVFKSNSLDTHVFESFPIDVHYSNGRKNIVLTNPTLMNVRSVELLNILGQSIHEIFNIKIVNHSEYEVTNLSSGAYIVKLNTEKGSFSKKVLVEN